MVNVKKSLIGLVTMWACMVATSTYGQIMYGQPVSGKLRLVYTHWTVKEGEDKRTLDQWMLPVSSFIPLKENLEARLFIAGVFNNLDQSGFNYNLNGATDLRLQINQSLSDDRILLSVGLNLPTGKSKLSFSEGWFVERVLALDFLTYPIRRLSDGPGVNLLLGGATISGQYRLGGSVMYYYSGNYEPYVDNGKYNAGNFLSINAGVQRGRAQSMWSGDLTFTTYGDDTLAGTKVYSRGNQLALQLGYAYDRISFRATGDLWYLIRGEHATFSPTEQPIWQQVYGNEFGFLGKLNWTTDNRRWNYGPFLEARLIDANGIGLGNAYSLGIGADGTRWLSNTYNIGLALKYFLGQADGGVWDLNGYQVMLSLGGVF